MPAVSVILSHAVMYTRWLNCSAAGSAHRSLPASVVLCVVNTDYSFVLVRHHPEPLTSNSKSSPFLHGFQKTLTSTNHLGFFFFSITLKLPTFREKRKPSLHVCQVLCYMWERLNFIVPQHISRNHCVNIVDNLLQLLFCLTLCRSYSNFLEDVNKLRN